MDIVGRRWKMVRVQGALQALQLREQSCYESFI